MGAEDFLVRLESPLALSRVLDTISRYPGTRAEPDVDRHASGPQFRVEDPDHIVELEVADRGGLTTISVRFALCHPPTIDAVFVELVGVLAKDVDATIAIAESVEPDDPGLGWSFSRSNCEKFPPAASQCIRKKRALWQRAFGDEQARLSCPEAIMRFIIEPQTRR
jgi:hypothetical protein